MEPATQFIVSSLEGNAIDAKDAFNTLIQSVIADKIDQLRPTIAASMVADA